MNKRTKMLTGTLVAVAFVASIGHWRTDEPRGLKPQRNKAETVQPQQELPDVKAVTADEVVAGLTAGLTQGNDEEKSRALSDAIDVLRRPEYAQSELSRESQEALARAAIAQIQGSTEASKDDELKAKLVKFLAARIRSETSRAFILDILDEGPQELRQAALDGISSPHGIAGKAVFAKVQELAERDLISKEALPGLLRRAGGKKAIEPIAELMKSTDDWRIVSACVVALEDYRDPKLLGAGLERLDQIGVLDDPKRLPWISARLLSAHFSQAQGPEVVRLVRAMKTRPSLVKPSAALLEKALACDDAETRRLSAEAVKKAVLARFVDKKTGEGLLSRRLERETEPVIKAELAGGLEQVRGLEEPEAAPQMKD